MPRKLTVGSTFAGIGGLELGLEWTGRFETAWQVENDPHALEILARRWPRVRRYTDVKTVGAGDLERVDVICGGFPCQDISNAGPKVGLSGGKRSILWYELARLIRELGPKYAIVENVAAILGRGADQVVGTLAEIGYDAEWDIIPALSFGAPHLRPRFILVAYPAEVADPDGDRGRDTGEHVHGGAVQVDGARPEERDENDALGVRAPGHAVVQGGARRGGALGQGGAHAAGAPRCGAEEAGPVGGGRPRRRGELGGPVPRVFGGVGAGPRFDPWWDAEPGVGRMADGVPRGVDRRRRLGNAVVPQLAEWVGGLVAADAVRRGYIDP